MTFLPWNGMNTSIWVYLASIPTLIKVLKIEVRQVDRMQYTFWLMNGKKYSKCSDRTCGAGALKHVVTSEAVLSRSST